MKCRHKPTPQSFRALKDLEYIRVNINFMKVIVNRIFEKIDFKLIYNIFVYRLFIVFIYFSSSYFFRLKFISNF
jgi:hypothetical protein